MKSKIWNYFRKICDKEAVSKVCNKKLKMSAISTNYRVYLVQSQHDKTDYIKDRPEQHQKQVV